MGTLFFRHVHETKKSYILFGYNSQSQWFQARFAWSHPVFPCKVFEVGPVLQNFTKWREFLYHNDSGWKLAQLIGKELSLHIFTQFLEPIFRNCWVHITTLALEGTLKTSDMERWICIIPKSKNLCMHYPLKVHSYYTAVMLRCRYIDYISATSHHSITAFQVKMNLTSWDTAECSYIMCVCSAATQHNCGVVWMALYPGKTKI